MANKYIKQLLITILASVIYGNQLKAQYNFKTDKKLVCTPIKNQQRTGTCWSFATTSFMESEYMRSTNVNKVDLSEMFIVRKIYEDKAQNYILRQGKANFSQGSLAHDLVKTVAKHGILPEKYYSGKTKGVTAHDHGELESAIKGYLDGVLASKRKSSRWRAGVSALLDIYLGPVPKEFDVDGKTYSAETFAQNMNIKPSDYVHISSFSHHPFYQQFILEIPDNYSNGSYHNLPINDLQALVDYALLGGYSIAWDGDVSEDGFDAREGLAVLPLDSDSDYFGKPEKEISVTQQNRQEAFENFSTTDDHLMHIVGVSFDQNGTKYYVIKNSWGEISPYKGYLYMSESYFKMKTVSVTLNKNALPEQTAKQLLVSND